VNGQIHAKTALSPMKEFQISVKMSLGGTKAGLVAVLEKEETMALPLTFKPQRCQRKILSRLRKFTLKHIKNS
jgi:hypothetical protein